MTSIQSQLQKDLSFKPKTLRTLTANLLAVLAKLQESEVHIMHEA